MNANVVRVGLATLLCTSLAAPVQAQQLKLPDMSKLAAEASEVVDISVDQALLGLAAGFMTGTGDDAALKGLLTGLKGVYVKTFEFDRPNAYHPSALDDLRRQLSTGGWTRLVTTRSAKDNSDVGVYLFREGDKTGGMAVLVTSPRELVIVNIVGSVDLEKLRQLQGQIGVPADLGLDR